MERHLNAKKGCNKDVHRKIIHCTCSDSVQKPNIGFPAQNDTCMNEAAAAACQHTIALFYCTQIQTQKGRLHSHTEEQQPRFCAQTLEIVREM